MVSGLQFVWCHVFDAIVFFVSPKDASSHHETHPTQSNVKCPHVKLCRATSYARERHYDTRNLSVKMCKI